ncbi:MAG TPA: histidine kinase [Chitinophagaceae bacterium]|nr:histidine kinase [Chitinophagaceae bacterium]
MKLLIDRGKVKFYVRLAVAFFILNLIGSLIDTPETFFKRAVNHAWLIIFLLPLNFILFEYSIPFIKLSWKRILAGLLLIWIHLMIYSFGLYAWRNFGILLHLYFDLNTFITTESGASFFMGYSAASIFFFGIVRHVYNYITLKNAAKQLRIEKQEAELNYLKAQTNPHFLFNTLNNIYSLARDKSDLAPESILRLSEILRFMLYETGGSYIAIGQELKIISDYIALEKLRYDDSLLINFNHDIEDIKQALPPLLLIPLVENAFKHGVSETRNKPFVDIHLSVNQRQLTFIVKNSTEALTGEKRIRENIGLANLRRQLELLYKDFNLLVQQGDAVFTATLKINLVSHV